MPPPPFAEVFNTHAPLVWRTLRRLSGQEIEDLVQEVFLVVHRKLPEFEGRSKLSTWIYGICIKVAADHRKKAWNRHEVLTDHPTEPSMAASQAAVIEARSTLDSLLQKLDEDKRAVFVLYEIEELPMSEVAEAVGVPLQTAYARLHAARKIVLEGGI